MSKQEVTVKDVMEGKMVADSMLSSLFIDLNDVEKTNRGVQSFIHLMTTYPAITKLVSCFMSKIKKVPTYLSQCSSFQKRILLFIVVECLMLGEHIDQRFTSENLAPLETALIRLSDIALAFQNVIKHPNFCDIWHHTVKQAVIAFLRKKQSVEASKILVLYRDRINEEQKKMLEKLIERTLNKKLDIEKLARTDGHDYTSYYFVMATFIKGLNNQLPKTTLHRFAAKISTSVKEQNDEEDQYEDVVDSGSDMDHDGINMDEPPEEMEENNEVDTTMEAEEDDTLIDVSSSDSGNVQEKIAKTKPLIEIPDSEEDQESDEDTTNDNNSMEKLDPKIGLTYRLKKQIHNSGIIIPCKHIVKHCREIHNEIEEIETGSSKQPYVKSKKKAYAPLTAEALSKAPYKPDISPRNLLLGERFEDLNSTFHSSVSSRTYSSRRRIPFTCDLDSYIVVGCRHFGIGQWTKTLNAFPFPQGCTNVKIKDRFRNLIKLKHIAILDDGDFNVLNLVLKSKLAAAEAKMNKDKNENAANKRYNNYDRGSSTRGSPASRRSEPVKKQVKPVIKRKLLPHNEIDEDSDDNTKKSSSRQQEFDMMSINSSERNHVEKSSGSRFSRQSKVVAFTPKQDAYLLCGARHLGMRWEMLKGYFNFNSNITTTDMQNRWDEMIENGQIYVNEDDREIFCRDENLQRRCEAVTDELQNRIQSQSKKDSGRESVDSPESDISSVTVPNKPSVFQRRQIESSHSSIEEIASEKEFQEELLLEQSTPIKRKSKSKKSNAKLNKSIDAGTQTRRPKFILRKQSPSLLEASSSSNSTSRSPSPQLERRRHVKQLGSPIRPSVLNNFKQPFKKFDESPRKRIRKSHRRDSYTKEIREKRQREISRMQRQSATSRRNLWTDAEVKEFLSGLEKHGPGNWSTILDDGYEVFNSRTSVMLKDKFRTMMKNNTIPEHLVLLWNAKKAAKE